MKETIIGSRINRYEIRETIHKSDLIGIYKAFDTKLERFVLLKLILHSADYSPEAKDFFLAEARTLAKLDHPNIAKVLDFGSENDNLYLISEYVTGNTLADLVNNPIPWQNAIQILLPITDALIYAHSRGVIHRDLKPDNIIIDADRQPILSDFSLIRIIEEEETRDMTGTNLGLGSANYISPEQGKGESVDFRSDIYSLGVIFYEMVTGKKLFYATSSMEIVIQHIMANPPRPRSIVPDLPKTVEAIILKALSKDPAKRYQSMQELSAALRAVMDVTKKARKPLSRRARQMIGAFSAALLLVVLGTVLVLGDRAGWLRSPPPSPSPSSLTSTLPSGSTDTPPAKTIVPTTSAVSVFTQTPAAAPVFTLPGLPVLENSRLPIPDQVLSPGNVAQITELARWGNPDIHQFAFINGDKNLLAATSAGLYYLDAGDLTARYFVDSGGVLTVLVVSEDGEWVVTGDTRGTVTVWNILNGEKLDQVQGKGSQITAIALSPDKSKVVFSDSNKDIHLWDLASDQIITFPKRHGLEIHSLIFSPGGNLIYSGSYDFQIILWDVNGKLQDKFTTDKKSNDLALSRDGNYLAAALNDSSIRIWDLTTRKNSDFTDASLATNFTSIAFLPKGDTFVTGSEDGYLRLWSVPGDGPLKPPLWETIMKDESGNAAASGPVKTLAVSDRGSQVAVMFQNGMVVLWNIATKVQQASWDWYFDSVKKVAISPDDRLLAYQLGNTFVKTTSVQSPGQTTRLAGTLPRGNPISIENKLVVIQAQPDLLSLYSLPVSPAQTPPTLYDFPVNGLVNFSPDGTMVAAFKNRVIVNWATSSGAELKRPLLKTMNQCQIIYGQDQTFVVAGSDNGILFSDANLEFFCGVSRNTRSTSEDFLDDGSIIAQSLETQKAVLSDGQNANQEIPTQSTGFAEDVAISKDGTLLAVASESGALELYDLKTRKLLIVLDLHTGSINHVLFSNNGKYIITGSADGTVRFFGIQA